MTSTRTDAFCVSVRPSGHRDYLRKEVMHKVDTGRLTTLDYARIDDTVGARCADLVRLAHTAYRLEYDTMSLTRLAHHSIGCTAADLRDCELDAIDAQVDFLIEFYA